MGSLVALCGATALLSLFPGLLPAAHADLYFPVHLDTSPLTGSLSANGPFSIQFQLIDGDGVANNTVTLTDFSFGTGSAGGNLQLFGGAAGDFNSGVTLSDSDPDFIFNAFCQDFTPGSTLNFKVNITTNYAGGIGGTPDRFTFVVLDGNAIELPTTGPASEFIGVDIKGTDSVVEVYDATNDYFAMGSPIIPEPSPLVLLSFALPVLALRLRKRRA